MRLGSSDISAVKILFDKALGMMIGIDAQSHFERRILIMLIKLFSFFTLSFFEFQNIAGRILSIRWP